MTDVRLTHIGGPTVLIEVDGWRLLTDPTFDAPGRRYGFGWGPSSEMHDLLYEHQARLRDEDLHAYAEQLGLDVGTFERELAEHVHAGRVHEDFMSGVRSGVNGTPTFYVNGARHDGSYDLVTLLAVLEQAA